MDEDLAWLNQSDITQGIFTITMHNRPGDKKGDRIVLMHRSQYNIRLLETGNTNIIECTIRKLNYKSRPVHILGSYHPPLNNTDHTTNVMFIDHLWICWQKKIPKQQNTIILGDFSMHAKDHRNRHNTSLGFQTACNQTNTQTMQYTRLNIHRTNIRNSSHKLHNPWIYLRSQSSHNRHQPEQRKIWKVSEEHMGYNQNDQGKPWSQLYTTFILRNYITHSSIQSIWYRIARNAGQGSIV